MYREKSCVSTFAVLFAALIFIQFTDAEAATPATTIVDSTVPSVTFDCTVNGKVDKIQVVQDAYKLFAKTDNGVCLYSDPLCHSQLSDKTEIHIVLQNEDDTNVLVRRNGITFEYLVKCKDEPRDFTAAVSMAGVPLPTYTKSQEISKDVPATLSLSLKSSDGGVIQGSVNVGDQLTLSMSVTGSHYMTPLQCTAYDTSGHQGNSHTLWMSESNGVSCSFDEAITEKMWKRETNVNNKLQIPIYAFRFLKSGDVYIVCKAHVCAVASNCPETCIKNAAKRKRRSLIKRNGLMSAVKTASTSYTISNFDTSDSAGLVSNRIICYSAVMAAIVLTRQILLDSGHTR